MTEPSVEEMMRFMTEGKRQMLYVAIVFFSLIFGVICLFLFILKKHFISDNYSLFVKGTFILSLFIYLSFGGYRIYMYKYAKNQTPFGGGIYTAYYECMKCESLHGGIYGKGPTKNITLDNKCIHKWNAIERISFEKAYKIKTKNKQQ